MNKSLIGFLVLAGIVMGGLGAMKIMRGEYIFAILDFSMMGIDFLVASSFYYKDNY